MARAALAMLNASRASVPRIRPTHPSWPRPGRGRRSAASSDPVGRRKRGSASGARWSWYYELVLGLVEGANSDPEACPYPHRFDPGQRRCRRAPDSLSSVTVIAQPADAPAGRELVHEMLDAGACLGAAEGLRPVDVVGSRVGQRAAAPIGVVHPHGGAARGGQSGVAAAPGLGWRSFRLSRRRTPPRPVEHPRTCGRTATSTRLALARKSGSRMKVHDWYCQGLIESWWSQRRTVDVERAGSAACGQFGGRLGHDQRDSGMPVSAGNCQARALVSATCTRVNRTGRPERPASARAGRPPWENRTRHRRTVSRCRPISRAIRAIRALERPRAARSTTCARNRPW